MHDFREDWGSLVAEVKRLQEIERELDSGSLDDYGAFEVKPNKVMELPK